MSVMWTDGADRSFISSAMGGIEIVKTRERRTELNFSARLQLFGLTGSIKLDGASPIELIVKIAKMDHRRNIGTNRGERSS